MGLNEILTVRAPAGITSCSRICRRIRYARPRRSARRPPVFQFVVHQASKKLQRPCITGIWIEALDEALHAAGVELCFAEMKDPVKDKLKRFGIFTRLGEHTFFATIGQAVNAYLAVHQVDWVDWEDRK